MSLLWNMFAPTEICACLTPFWGEKDLTQKSSLLRDAIPGQPKEHLTTSVLPDHNVFGFTSPFLPSLNCKFRESKNYMSASLISPQSLGQLEERRNSIRLKLS